jgi:hypothetical protein
MSALSCSGGGARLPYHRPRPLPERLREVLRRREVPGLAGSWPRLRPGGASIVFAVGRAARPVRREALGFREAGNLAPRGISLDLPRGREEAGGNSRLLNSRNSRAYCIAPRPRPRQISSYRCATTGAARRRDSGAAAAGNAGRCFCRSVNISTRVLDVGLTPDALAR